MLLQGLVASMTALLPSSTAVLTANPFQWQLFLTGTRYSTMASCQSSVTSGESRKDSKQFIEPVEQRRSSVGEIMSKAKAKLTRAPSGSEALPDDEADFERQKAKEVVKQKRQEDYERLDLEKKTKFGMGGGNWTG